VKLPVVLSPFALLADANRKVTDEVMMLVLHLLLLDDDLASS
jgi:hypothetical protein